MNRSLMLAGLAALATVFGTSGPAMSETVTLVAERIQRVSVSTAPRRDPRGDKTALAANQQSSAAGQSRVRTIPLWSAPYSSQRAVSTPGLLDNDGAFASHTPGAIGSARAGGAAAARFTAAGAAK